MNEPGGHQGLTRRRLLGAAAALGGALTASGAAADSPKVSKDCVHFKEASDDEKICGNCRLFRKPSTCALVAGEFDKHNTCRIWAARA